MGMQPAATLQGRAGRVLFRIFLASLSIFILAMVLLTHYLSGPLGIMLAAYPDSGLSDPIWTWLAVLLMAVMLVIFLAWHVSGRLAKIILEPLISPWLSWRTSCAHSSRTTPKIRFPV